MHVETIGAAIHLRGAKLDQLDQPLRQSAFGEIDLDRAQRLIAVGRNLGRHQALGMHGEALSYAAPALRCAYFRAKSMYHSRHAGLAIASLLMTFSMAWPSSRRLIGSSCF